MTTHQDTSTERELLLVPAMLDAYIEAIKASGEYERWHYIPEVESARDAVAQSLAALSSRDEAAQQPQGPSAEDVRELSKWLNEEVSAPINRQALARVLAVQQPQERDPSGIYQIYGSWVVCVDGTRIPGTYQSWLGARLAPALPDDVLLDLMNKAAPNDISDKAVFSAYQEHQKTQAQQAAAVPDFELQAEIAGLESATGHLSQLVDEQRALLTEAEDVFGRDGHGGRYEDGECELIDRIRAHLEMIAAPAAPPAPVLPLSDEQIESLLVNWPKDGIAFIDFARAIEAAHGITEPGAGGEPT